MITEALLGYTALHSNFESSRNYVSLSKAIASVEKLINDYKNGFADSLTVRLKCYKGYQMEADMKRRIKTVFPDNYSEAPEISVHGGLIKGHPDFLFNGYPGDCKSVLMDDWIPKDKIPSRIYFQMQAYMLYMKKTESIVVFESRESGMIQDFKVYANFKIQKQIEDKYNEIARILK